MTNSNLKSINVIRYDGKSINLNIECMSHTSFQQGQVLEASIYGNMIIIKPAIEEPVLN